MATALSSIVTNVRITLNETTANFWTDAELLTHVVDGARDLWKAIIDLDEGFFQTIDDTNVSLAASTDTLTGVPADVFRVNLIEPRTVTSDSSTCDVNFEPCKKNHANWTGARALGTVDPTGRTILYDIRNAGSPVTTPSIDVAPKINAALLLRLIYIRTLGTLTSASDNPIPGESDHALWAWSVAHALAKERADRKPHPDYMAIYATDKQHILTACTPRQTQEPEVAEGFLEYLW